MLEQVPIEKVRQLFRNMLQRFGFDLIARPHADLRKAHRRICKVTLAALASSRSLTQAAVFLVADE
jgi:hypothetical protein